MKTVKTLNKWVLKEKKKDEATNDSRLYSIFSPDKRCMEDNLTFEEAIDFAEENHDFVANPRKAKFSKDELVKYIEDGVWFKDERYGGYVFMKHMGDRIIQSLWLNIHDPESMSFQEYNQSSWDWNEEEQSFTISSSGVYHFGSTMQDREDNHIYDEDNVIVEEKLFNVIFNSYENKAANIFESVEQLQYFWEQVKQDDVNAKLLKIED